MIGASVKASQSCPVAWCHKVMLINSFLGVFARNDEQGLGGREHPSLNFLRIAG